MRSLQKSDVSQPSVQASETPAQRRQRGHWLDALAASATRARRLAGVAVALSGALLLVQSAAIAWLVQAGLGQHLGLGEIGNGGAGVVVGLVRGARTHAWGPSWGGDVAAWGQR
ncbi:thiol reductant ABC exporter subunit CydD, partial [Xanthomonas perforans]